MLGQIAFFYLCFLTLQAKQIRSQFIAHYSNKQVVELLDSTKIEPLTTTSSLLKPLLVPRVSGTEGNLKVQEFLKTTLKKLNYHIEEDSFQDETPYGTKSFNNIIATKDPTAKNKLVLSCHFDSKYFESFEFIGATDSSAPCAILLDVATSLNPLFETRLKFKQNSTGALFNGYIDLESAPTIQYIFFDGEEAFRAWSSTDSLYGSRHLAKKWEEMVIIPAASSGDGPDSGLAQTSKNILSTINALVLLDLLGTPHPRIPNTNDNTEWAWARLMDIENRLYQENLLSKDHMTQMKKSADSAAYFVLDARASKIEDDHIPFKERGVPIVHVIPQPFPDVWHTIKDNADAISDEVVQDFAHIFRIFVAEYFGLI